nr:ring-box protein 1 [Cryptomonas sp.]
MDFVGEKMKKFKIIQISGVSTWKWQDCIERCAICRNHFREPSIEYQSNKTLHQRHISTEYDDTHLIGLGNCGHSFHIDCIERWLHEHQKCPLCARIWIYNKISEIEE